MHRRFFWLSECLFNYDFRYFVAAAHDIDLAGLRFSHAYALQIEGIVLGSGFVGFYGCDARELFAGCACCGIDLVVVVNLITGLVIGTISAGTIRKDKECSAGLVLVGAVYGPFTHPVLLAVD